MSDRVQTIIDVIDVGLQTAMPDPTFGEVSPVNRESCWRCGRPSAPDSATGLCTTCRFHLSHQVPDPSQYVPTPEAWAQLTRAFNEVAQQLVGAFDALMQSPGWKALAELAEQLAPAEETRSLPRLRHGSSALCPRHGPTRGGTCHRCRRA